VCGDLHLRGELIGNTDILIAGTALDRGLVLVVNNERHVRRVRDLVVDNWPRPSSPGSGVGGGPEDSHAPSAPCLRTAWESSTGWDRIEPALSSVRPGLSEAKEILRKHAGLRCVIASEVERLLGEPEALTSPLAREVLGERVLRPLEKNGSPYTYLVFARERTVSERRPPTPLAAVP
jgi:hypothetical protein